jgi:hypothetical protein
MEFTFEFVRMFSIGLFSAAPVMATPAIRILLAPHAAHL